MALKRLLLLLSLLIPQVSFAATYNVGIVSSSSLQGTINSAAAAGGGNVIQLSIGTYNTTSALNIPCPASPLTILGAPMVSSGSPASHVYTVNGITFTFPGPQSQWKQDPYTTKMSSSIGASTWQINLPSGCSTQIIIANIEWNGNEPSGGGGGSIFLSGNGGNNVAILNNWLHGSWASTTNGHEQDGQIWIDGYSTNGGQVWTNVTIDWNNFGSSTDCNPIMTLFTYQGGNYDSNGGYCNGVSIHSSMTNFNMLHNAFYHEEQCSKGFLGGNAIPNVYNVINSHVDYNDCYAGHRNPLEYQLAPQSMTFDYNSWHDLVAPGYSGWMFSGPQGPTYHADNNVFVSNTSSPPVAQPNGTSPPAACECWGNGSFSNNLVQGFMSGAAAWGYGGPMQMNNNVLHMPGGYYLQSEGYSGTPPATQSGNVQSNKVSALTSQTPTISPASGGQAYPLAVTLTDLGFTSGAGPLGNTGIWYTIDGTTPVPGSGTAKRADSGDVITLPAPGQVCAVGMWGSANQPLSYPNNYGFVPSAMVCQSYTTGSGVTLTSVTLACPSTSLTAGGATTTCTLTGHYSNSTTANLTGSGTYTSSNTTAATVSPSAVVTPLAQGTTNITGSYGVLNSTVPIDVAASGGGGGGPTPNYLGNQVEDYDGVIYSNNIVGTYAISPSVATTPGNCHLYIPPGTTTVGKHFDCMLVSAPTTNTEGTSAICHGTYTITASSGPDSFVTVPMSGCGTIAANTAYWLFYNTDDPAIPPMGWTNCGSSCGTTAPTTYGTGTYIGYYASVTYGTYTGLPSTLKTAGAQPSIYLDLTASSTPTLQSAYQGNAGNVSQMILGAGIQQHCYAVYSDGVIEPDTAFTRGESITAWNVSSGSILTVGAVGSGSPGLVTGAGYGTATSTCTLTGSVVSSPWTWTITNTPMTGYQIQGMKISGMSIQ